MKAMKKLASLFIATAMCGAFSGSAYADVSTDPFDNLYKVSDYLLEQYGVSRDEILAAGRANIATSEIVPVLVWASNDIDHTVAEQQALPILVASIEDNGGKIPSHEDGKFSLDDIFDTEIEPSAEAVQEFIETERSVSREMYAELNGKFVSECFPDSEITFVSEYSPVIIASLSLDEVLDLANSDAISLFDFCCEEGNGEDPQDVSIEAAKGRTVHTTPNYGYTGNGIKIGQLEYAVPELDNSQLSPISSRITRSGSGYAGNHASFVACIMVGQDVGTFASGMAPNAELYSATCKDFNNNDLAAVEWLLNQGVNVINASHAFGHSSGHNEYTDIEKWLDHLAVEHYVTFVESAGNDASTGIISGAMAYNIITVGNVNDGNTIPVNNDVISSSSSYYNENTHLAYKPDLCAPGTGIRNAASIGGASGTSASAPHVTGAIALLFEAKPILKISPVEVKALLTAAVSPESSHRYCPEDSGYRQYGAGLLDIYRVIKSVKESKYRSSTLSSTNYTKSYTMPIYSTGSTVRVSLTFLKNSYAGSSHTSLGGLVSDPVQDLDLWVFDPNGTLVDNSLMIYTNVEIVEFTPTQTGMYTIKVVKTLNSYETPVTFGIAWMEAN